MRDEPDRARQGRDRARFARLVARPEPEIDLAVGALCIAADTAADLDGALARHSTTSRTGCASGSTAATDPRSSSRGCTASCTARSASGAARCGVARRPQQPARPGAGARHRAPDHAGSDRARGRLASRPAAGDRDAGPLHHPCAVGHAHRSGGRGAAAHPRRLPGAAPPLGRRGRALPRRACSARRGGARSSPGSCATCAARLTDRNWPAALGDRSDARRRADRARSRAGPCAAARPDGPLREAIAGLGRYLEERPDAHDADDVRQVIGIFGGRLN